MSFGTIDAQNNQAVQHDLLAERHDMQPSPLKKQTNTRASSYSLYHTHDHQAIEDDPPRWDVVLHSVGLKKVLTEANTKKMSETRDDIELQQRLLCMTAQLVEDSKAKPLPSEWNTVLELLRARTAPDDHPWRVSEASRNEVLEGIASGKADGKHWHEDFENTARLEQCSAAAKTHLLTKQFANTLRSMFTDLMKD
eukprot:6097466-Amphidinium_carterae.1